jgi:prepilin signal peptidase PulO-like enzyme (type II secretory pathway)
MIYLLQAGCTLAILYTIYWLFLSRTGRHKLNRFVLIGIAVTTLLLPLATRLLPDLLPSPNITANGYVRYTAPTSLFTATQQLLRPTSPNTSMSPATILKTIYVHGLIICLIRVIAPIITLINLIRKNPTRREPHYTLVQLNQPTPPFSFFRYIFLNKNEYSEAQQRNILLHEQVHIQQHHTLDILFMELFAAFAWFHPFAWRLNTQTKLNLEYLADNQLIKTGVEPKEYQYQLLQLTLGPSLSRMANYFNQSHLQKRIAMINNTTRRNNSWKYLLFLPALAACSLLFSSANAQSAKTNTDIYLVIRPSLTEPRIQKLEAELAADGISLQMTNLAYTESHQLTGFRLVLTKDDHTLEDLTITPSGQPLSEPVVLYWFRGRQGQLGLTRGLPTDLDKKDLNIMQNLDGLLRKNPGTNEFDLHGSARIGD